MMHCDRCNIDFPEGLRYCKWCGQTLTARRRVTNELHSCPACAAPVQATWAFCKACGAKLTAPAREPIGAICPRCGAMTDPRSLHCLRCGEDLTRGAARPRADSGPVSSTSVIAHCASCGEPLDAGSMYCKACGAAVYETATPFGDSSLLCPACNSHSPIGSSECRVCGASLGISEEPKKKSSTLPDLAEHMPPEPQQRSRSTVVDTGGIGAAPPSEDIPFDGRTIIAGTPIPFIPPAESREEAPSSRQELVNSGAQTTVLPGVAGSSSEVPPPTSPLQKGKKTSPVRGVEPESSESGALPAEAPPADSRRDSAALHQERQAEFGDRTIELSAMGDQKQSERAPVELPPPPPLDMGTGIFGSQVEPPAPFTSDNATIEFKSQSIAPSHEEIHTAPFGLGPPAPPQAGSIDSGARGEAAVEEGADANRVTGSASMTETQEVHSQSTTPMTYSHLPASAVAAEPVAADTVAADAVAADPVIAEQAAPPAPQTRSGALIASIAVGVGVIALTIYALWWFVSGGSRAVPQPQEPPVATSPPATATQPAAPSQPAAPAAPPNMVLVAKGAYIIGSDSGDELARPKRTVELPAFFIDRTEVTNADYKRFIDATGHKAPDGWRNSTYPEGSENWPVTGVSWQDAVDYSAWAGKRLPTEIEWEASARGAEGRKYPWGNDWQSGLANVATEGIVEVGQYRNGASPAGALDMIGNVWEWTADRFQLYPNSPAKMPPQIKPGGTYRVIRGGAYDGDESNDATRRGFLDASKGWPKTGFRCVKDVAP